MNIEDVVKVLNEDLEDDQVNQMGDSSSDSAPEDALDMLSYGVSEVSTEITDQLAKHSLFHGFELNYKREMASNEKELSKSEDY